MEGGWRVSVAGFIRLGIKVTVSIGSRDFVY